MLEINLSNIEEKIFQNLELRKKMPEFLVYFKCWDLGKIKSHLKSDSKKAVFRVLNNLNDRHCELLEDYFKQKITINKIENNFIKNINSNIEQIEFLDWNGGFKDFCVYRENEKLYISLWK